ncbi:MAG: hypothetical protein AAFY35_16120 [Pseudomonadota bacterium]
MKIYIHIGDARTGTTTLQSLLAQNRDVLSSMGIAYPKLGTMQNSSGFGHHRLAFSLLPEWPQFAIKGKAPAGVIWQEFRDHLDQLPSDTKAVVISSEAFLNLKDAGLSQLNRYLDGHEVVPICVKRDPEDWRRSWIAHQTRQGVVVHGAKRPAQDLAQPKIDRWNAVFEVTCVPYSANTAQDVLAIMSVDIDRLKPVERINSRLTDFQLDLLQTLNRIPMEEGNRDAFLNTINSALAEENPRLTAYVKRVNLAEKTRSRFNEDILTFL